MLWRLVRDDHRAKFVVVPQWRDATILAFINDQIWKCEQVASLGEAIAKAAAIRRELEDNGWREG